MSSLLPVSHIALCLVRPTTPLYRLGDLRIIHGLSSKVHLNDCKAVPWFFPPLGVETRHILLAHIVRRIIKGNFVESCLKVFVGLS